jgi:THO complex subunit 7
VIKKFHNYTSLSHTPIVPAAAPGTSVEDAREAFLVELATFQLSLKKSAMICEAEARQVEEYQRERQRIGEWGSSPQIDHYTSYHLIIEDEHGKLRGQIEQLKIALEHAHILRRRKIEYDLVAEKVNTLPSREELEQ